MDSLCIFFRAERSEDRGGSWEDIPSKMEGEEKTCDGEGALPGATPWSSLASGLSSMQKESQ